MGILGTPQSVPQVQTERGSNQRQWVRKSLNAEISAGITRAGAEVFFDTKDLSRGGVFLRSSLLFERGQRLFIFLELPGLPERLKITGEVVWVEHRPPGPGDDRVVNGMGLKFLDLSEADARVIDAFLLSIG